MDHMAKLHGERRAKEVGIRRRTYGRALRTDCWSFDHRIRTEQEGLRNRQSQGARGPLVNHEFELGRLLDRKISRVCALQNLVDEGRGLAELFDLTRSE